MDRISNLPDSVTENILERLPQQYRVRTSVLSTKWRFLWTELPSLVLDKEFCHSVGGARVRRLSNYFCIISSLVLQRRRNARDLSLFIPRDVGRRSFVNFDQLINCFLRNGLEKLSLEQNFYYIAFDRVCSCMYRVPSFVFTSAMSSIARLTDLQLYRCEFSPPLSFEGFPTLVSFELQDCETAAELLSHFVASCPMLQKLVLQKLNFPLQSLNIDAPALRYLCVQGNFKWLCLVNAESIEVLDIDMEILPDPWEGMPAFINTFFDKMSKLEKITLGGRICELLAHHGGDSLRLARYDRLKSLAFVRLQTADALDFVSNSIRCFPNLTELTISLDDGADGSAITAIETNKDESAYTQDNAHDPEHLLRVDFQNITGAKFWMKLIERVLHCCVDLKLMSIKFDKSVSQDKMLNYVREITKFCRASNIAKIDISECTHPLPPPRRYWIKCGARV